MSKLSMMELDDELDAQFDILVNECMTSGAINLDLYTEYDVKRGLRDSSGKGVLTGLTEISDVKAFKAVEGVNKPTMGKLFYQGYDVEDLIDGRKGSVDAFEETIYLLLFGQLPTKAQLDSFTTILKSLQELSGQFVRDVIMKNPSKDMMNALQRSVITLYSFDDNPDDISISNVLRQSLQMIAKMPLMAVYAYYSYRHFHEGESLIIRLPEKSMTTAENILQMLRPDGKFTELEAKVLDTALVLHADHGGGNNSTFTNHVVTSSGTDTYSAVAASIASLKGPRHGGANLKVEEMFEDLRKHCPDYKDEAAISTYLDNVLQKKAFDGAGLIYGMGHAVYTDSDPREVILKKYAYQLAQTRGLEEKFALYDTVERLGKEAIKKQRTLFKPVCANVDFYSGFVYDMLGIPKELFTPIFAISRISGWSAHRLEELVNKGKIIRPAYKYVGTHRGYVKEENRE